MGLIAALGFPWGDGRPVSKPTTLARLGAAAAVVAFLPGEVVQAAVAAGGGGPSFFALIAVTGSFMAVYAIAYCVALTIGQNRYLHRPWLNATEAMIDIFGGAVIGLVSGGLAQAFFGIATLVGQGNLLLIETARIIAWAMFGALIGLGMSFIIPNLGRLQGLLGGAAGGAVGALGFIICTILAGDAVGRFIGMAIVGWALGYAIGLVEEASRAAWLQVTYGSSRETVRVSLGADLVCVGSNSQRCAVWAQGARAIALRFKYVDGKVTCDDMAAERSFAVDPGFQQQVGNVTVLVCVGGATYAPSGGGTADLPPIPPPSGAAPAPPPPPRPVPPPPPAGPRVATNNGVVRPPATAPSAGSASPASPPRRGAPPPPPPPPPRR